MWTRLALLAQETAAGSTAAGWFDDIDADQKFVLSIIAIGCSTIALIILSGIVAGYCSSVHQRRVDEERRSVEDDMKRDMLDRGMTGEEIARVIEATAPPGDGLGRWLANLGKKK